MKKITALILTALLVLPLSACMGSTTQSKSNYQITVYADQALETALTDIAKAYTLKPAQAEDNPSYNAASEVLFQFGTTQELQEELNGGAYCDVFIPAGTEFLEGRELAGESALTITSGDGTAYPAALLKMSDRQEAAQAFLGYLLGAKAGEVFSANGFTAAR